MEASMQFIKKRDGTIVLFNRWKITNAILNASKSVGKDDKKEAEILTEKVITILEYNFIDKIPTVEDIQDIVERVLIKRGHSEIAKAFILYRQKRMEFRESNSFLTHINKIISGYIEKKDWRTNENSNAGYSMSGLQAHISGATIAEYTLNTVYPQDVSFAHRDADLHIHDLSHGIFAGYCAGWSLYQLLTDGFNGIPGKIAAKPAKHFDAILGQIVNFFGTLQNEWAGAQALSSFDTYLAPFIRKDNLTYTQVKQSMQEFIFGINQTSRWGNQVPFTNLTFDWRVPDDLKNEHIVIGGKIQEEKYGDFQNEMDLINKAFIEIMMEGDMNKRIFTFPIPTYNITKDFDWDDENAQLLFKMTSIYGIPYFQNFINSSLKPSDVRSMCCRLQLNLNELRAKTGGLFGSGEQTGSVGVVTINLPRIGFLSETKEEFFKRLERMMFLAKTSLEIKRKEVEKCMDNGLLPYSKRYLGNLQHHFSTIGLCGMHEACLNHLKRGINTEEGKNFAVDALDFMRVKLKEYQEETGHLYNLEATPAEGTSYRLAKHDKEKYPEIITAGTLETPYYTNSTQLPVTFTNDVLLSLGHQDELQCKYTGGTVLHIFLGEKINDYESTKNLIKKIAYNFKLPYFTITPTFSICPVHGYISGKHYVCPYDHTNAELNQHGIEIDGGEQIERKSYSL